ncbi:lipocalin-like domain-containing protein [Paludibaculum fermentans]|uniref:lipocalin-like domain-containing protein n=1 Tax=Paludibaculum fermentans TaxID=1473598 RepID=UPI003EB87B35
MAAQNSTHPLAGTWQLLRAEVAAPDGAISADPSYGASAKGLLIVDQGGRYSLQVFRPVRPKFAARDKAKGSAEEYRDAVIGASTHTGTIEYDAAAHKLIFRIDLAMFPNWENTEQVRDFQLTSDGVLSYTVPPRPGGARAISVWKRISPHEAGIR